MTALPDDNQSFPTPDLRGRLRIDEPSIELLGRLAQSEPFDESVLVATPAQDMAGMIQQIVAALRTVNVEVLVKKQNLLSRLTGADIEAKLKFELAVREVMRDLEHLREKSGEAKRMRETLRRTRAQILEEQQRLDHVISAAKAVLQDDPTVDAFLKDRFERCLLNLIALHASNTMTCEHTLLAEDNISRLVDRLQEVDTVIFPLWQRDALAITQSAEPISRKSKIIEQFTVAHNKLLEHLF